MTKIVNPSSESVFFAAFQFVFNDSLEEYEKVRSSLCKHAQIRMSNDAILSTESNDQRIVFQTQDQIDAFVDGIWTATVDILRGYKKSYGCSASAKRKILTLLGINNFIDAGGEK